MPTQTYIPLANLTLSGSVATVTFSSISQSYRDLVLIANGYTSTLYDDPMVRVNSDTGANYNRIGMGGNGSTTSSSAATNSDRFYPARHGWDNANRNMLIINFIDYSATDKHKSILTRSDSPSVGTGATAQRWASTSAITSITFFTNANMAAGTTLALYGIAS